MDPFRLCLAFGPVAVYLLLLGTINLSRRPFLVGGGRDAATLGLALAGLAIVGPMELFFPSTALARLGVYVWPMLMLLYGLLLVLLLLNLRPRLVIYNIKPDQLRPVLAGVVDRLDPDARWAGDSVALPHAGIQLHIETFRPMRNVSLVALGAKQNPSAWRQLEQMLGDAFAAMQVRRNNRTGLLLVVFGSTTIGIIVSAIARDPESVYRALFEMFRHP